MTVDYLLFSPASLRVWGGTLRVFFSADYVRAAYAWPTTRKSGWIADSLRERPIVGVELTAPVPLSAQEIATVHAGEYVEAVRVGQPRDLAESQGFEWDTGLWTSVVASTGGLVSAACAALSMDVAGSLSGGLHHAKRERGDGFCTFNGLALAARAALREGARSVMILDLDAHCGGGTYSLIAGDSRIVQTDVSVSSYDWYEPAPGSTLDIVHRPGEYLPMIERRLAARAAHPPSLCLYNAGMDPHERCAIGGLPGVTTEMLAERERLVFDWCVAHRVPIAFVLAGGYTDGLTESELVDLHRLTIQSAADVSERIANDS